MAAEHPTEAESGPRRRMPRALVAGVVALGATPDAISYAGLLLTLAAAAVLAVGAGHAPFWEATTSPAPASAWPLAATVLIALAAVADLLDGDVARATGVDSGFGAVLDSTLDRIGDMALYAGCTLYWAAAGNLTYVLLASLAAISSVLVSYVKARGENVVAGLGMGFWQRGERFGTLLVATAAGHVAAALWILAVFPAFTALRRLRAARSLIAGAATEPPTFIAARLTSRHSLAYWSISLATAIFVIVAPRVLPALYGTTDPLSAVLATATR